MLQRFSVKDVEVNLGLGSVSDAVCQLTQMHRSVRTVDLSSLPIFHPIVRPVKAVVLSTHPLQFTVRDVIRR
jgi:hypothetical protein